MTEDTKRRRARLGDPVAGDHAGVNDAQDSRSAGFAIARSQLADRVAAVAAREDEFAALSTELAAARARATDLAATLVTREAELTVIRTSLSWRVTAPFRRLSERFPAIERMARVGAKFVWF